MRQQLLRRVRPQLRRAGPDRLAERHEHFHGSAFFKNNRPGAQRLQKDTTALGRSARRSAPQRRQPAAQPVPRVGDRAARSLSGNNAVLLLLLRGRSRNSSDQPSGTEWIETPESSARSWPQRPAASRRGSFRRHAHRAMIQRLPRGVTNPPCSDAALDIGSLAGVARRARSPTSSAAASTASPTCSYVQLACFSSDNTARQFNTRVDLQRRPASDLIAFSTYIVPVTTTSNDSSTVRQHGAADRRLHARSGATWSARCCGRAPSRRRCSTRRASTSRAAPSTRSRPTRHTLGHPAGTAVESMSAGENLLFECGPGVGPGVFYQTTYNFRNTLSKVVGHARPEVRRRDQRASRTTTRRRGRAARSTPSPASGLSPTTRRPSRPATSTRRPADHRRSKRTSAHSVLRALRAGRLEGAADNLTRQPRPALGVFRAAEGEVEQPSIAQPGARAGGALTGAQLAARRLPPRAGPQQFRPAARLRLEPGPDLGRGFENKMVHPRRLRHRVQPHPAFGDPRSGRHQPSFLGVFTRPRTEHPLHPAGTSLNSLRFPSNPNTHLSSSTRSLTSPSGVAPSLRDAVSQDIPNPYTYRYSLDRVRPRRELGRGARLSRQRRPQSRASDPEPSLRRAEPAPRQRQHAADRRGAELQRHAPAREPAFRAGLPAEHGVPVREEPRQCSSDSDCRQTYPFDQSMERGPSDYDVRHALKVYGVWQLPFFLDREDLVGALAGGWESSGIVTASSGFPWTPVVGGDLCQVTVAGGGICPLRPIHYLGAPPARPTTTPSSSRTASSPAVRSRTSCRRRLVRSRRRRGRASAATASAAPATSRWT